MKTELIQSAIAAALTGLALLPVTMSGQLYAGVVDVHYGSETIDGVSIAYREVGDPADPTVLLLHGFPTSSHMFRDLFPALSDKYHVIAPDYPGFGASDMPDAADYEYNFSNAAVMVTELLDAKGVEDYAVYLMEYGAPVGYRMFAEHPERVTGFIIQSVARQHSWEI